MNELPRPTSISKSIKVLKVGIFTPYLRNEKTLAALQLADWLKKCGMTVSVLSATSVQQGIHSFWDKKVKKANEASVYKWAYNCNILIWFFPDYKRLQQSHLVSFSNEKRKTKNFFVPCWDEWEVNHDAFLAQADKILCLNRDIYLWLKTFRPANKLLAATRVYGTLTSPDVVLTPKPSISKKDSRKILVYLPKNIELDISPEFFDVLHEIVDKNRNVCFDFLAERSLNSTYNRRIKKLLTIFPANFSFQFSLPYSKYCQLAKEADWIYVTNTRFKFGSVFNLFAASTTPFICHAIPPVSSYVNNKINGIWVDCRYLSNPYPVADLDLVKVKETLNRAIDLSVDSVLKLQITNFSLLQQRQKAFERFLYSEIVEV